MIKSLNLQKMFPSIVYRRGRRYYKEDRVGELLFDKNHGIWTASVRGSEDHYFVEIDSTMIHQGSINAYCECPAFKTYDSCKHIVAVLLSISKKESEGQPDYRLTERFLNDLASVETEEVSEWISLKEQMHVEYYLKTTYDQLFQLEVKTGIHRSYVVKDLYKFLEHVLNDEEYDFTKKFTYHPDQHYFASEDRDIFELLYAMIRNEKVYQEHFMFGYTSHRTDRRFIIIQPTMLQPLIKQLTKREVSIEIDRIYKDLKVVNHTAPPFQFKLIEQDGRDDIWLDIQPAQEGKFFKPYQLFFLDGTFFFLSENEAKTIERISEMRSFSPLPIEQKLMGKLVSEVLPHLEKMGDVHLSEAVSRRIKDEPLKATMHLKLENDLLIGRLIYQYGDDLIDPFKDQTINDVYIVRDVKKERQIMNIVEQINFHYNGEVLYLPVNDDDLYHFIYRTLPILKTYVTLHLSSNIERLIETNELTPAFNISFSPRMNLLDIGFEMEGIDDLEIDELIGAVIEKKRYYRLQDGGILSLETDAFEKIQHMFKELDLSQGDVHQGRLTLPAYKGLTVDAVIQSKKHYDQSFQKLLKDMNAPEKQAYVLPDHLQGVLRDYQKRGFQWFKTLSAYQFGGILADDMGLGKTVQSIAYILSEARMSEQIHLVIAPSSVVYNWKNEFSKFAPGLEVTVMTGTKEERLDKFKNEQHVDVWITSYGTLRQDIETYKHLTFQTMILDEAQYIKNYTTKTSAAVRTLKAGRKFALSGTPIENSIDELWAIFQVVLPGLLPSLKKFKKMPYEKIAQMTSPFILRRLKQDVLQELPEKIESIHLSELKKEQKQLYVGYLRQVQNETVTSLTNQTFQQNRIKILAGLTRLRQICCHPALFIENYGGTSGKLEQLMDTVRNAVAHRKRMLIFSQFTSMHDIIRRSLDKEGIQYFYIYGQTPSKERVEISERFNEGEKDVVLISLKAGGTGLNLTGADTVILFDLWWNPAVEDQAAGRAHRLGQQNKVQVIRMMTRGTIEEKIYHLQLKKRQLIDQVIQPGETMLSSLSEEDIKELLNLS